MIRNNLVLSLLTVASLLLVLFTGCAKSFAPATKGPISQSLEKSDVIVDSIKYTDSTLQSRVVLNEAYEHYLFRAREIYGDTTYHLQNLSSPFCVAAFDREQSMLRRIIIFDNTTTNYKDIDVQELNPYRKYFQPQVSFGSSIIQQISGHNYLNEGYSLGDIPKGLMPSKLYDSTPKDYGVYAIHGNTYIYQSLNLNSFSTEPLIVKFGIDLLPHEEILEHVAYPGLSSLYVIDSTSGEIISRIEDLPFVVQDVVVDANNSGRLLTTHLSNIDNERMYNENEYWHHFSSLIYSNKVCTVVDDKDEVFIEKDPNTGLLYFCTYQQGYGDGNISLGVIDRQSIKTIENIKPEHLITNSHAGVSIEGVSLDVLNFSFSEKIKCN